MLYRLITNNKSQSAFVILVTNDSFTMGLQLGMWRRNVLDAINPNKLDDDDQPFDFDWLFEDDGNSILLTQSEPFTPDVLTQHPELFI